MNNDKVERKIKPHIFNLQDKSRRKIGLMTILELQAKKHIRQTNNKQNLCSMLNKGSYSFSKNQSQPNIRLKSGLRFPLLNNSNYSGGGNGNDLFIPSNTKTLFLKKMQQEKVQFSRSQSCFKSKCYSIVDKSNNNYYYSASKLLVLGKQKPKSSIKNKIFFKHADSNQHQNPIKGEQSVLIKKIKSIDLNDKCPHDNKPIPLKEELQDCVLDYCFQTIQNEALSFSQTVYCALERVIDIQSYYAFGLFDGYGPGGKIIARHFKNYFKKQILNKANYSHMTNSSSKALNDITKDDYYFIRKIFIDYSKIVVDLPAYARCKESGVSLFIALIVHNTLLYLSLGDIKAYLISKEMRLEREHIVIEQLNIKDNNKHILWEDQIVNLTVNQYYINKNSQCILLGTHSLLNNYSTVKAFEKLINTMIDKDSVTSIVNDLILLHKRKCAYLNEGVHDSGLGLIKFNT